jgi:anti-sigma-K factor RskA
MTVSVQPLPPMPKNTGILDIDLQPAGGAASGLPTGT